MWPKKTNRDGAIKKLKTIAQLVGYSTNAPDVAPSKALDEYYKDCTITAKDYFDKQLKCSFCSAKDTLRQLPLTANKSSTGMVSTIVNAYYNPSFNSVNFPAGVLPLPFFNVKSSEYIIYGSMDFSVCHVHGRVFDKSDRTTPSLVPSQYKSP
ncbi:hypothetical protein F5H01DRAFT_327638 [Linnemannia elongata]|nr:hypothetical protein F5H01DRAFT_327638 [Linnemannia elongata]